MSGSPFNSLDPKYRSDIPEFGFLIGDNVIDAEGERVIIVGTLSGHEVEARGIIHGKEERRRVAILNTKPEVIPVYGKGGGLKTNDGHWYKGRLDEVFLLTSHGLAVLTLFDQHNVVIDFNRRAQELNVDAMYAIRWRLTKEMVPDNSGYEHATPRFEVLGAKGEPDGPTDAEIARAEKLAALIAQIRYPAPDAPLRLVVNGPPDIGAPPVQSSSDYDDIPF
jgi:hypothetical protein